MDYKLSRDIRYIAFKVKLNKATPKAKMALRQCITSYFQDGIFHFKCQNLLHVSIYIIYFYMIKNYKKFCKIWYKSYVLRPYSQRFKGAPFALSCFYAPPVKLTGTVEKGLNIFQELRFDPFILKKINV